MSLPPNKIKQFKIESWTNEGMGKKIMVYADPGMGKTTLASLAPKPVFIAPDDGGRLFEEATGTALKYVPGLDTYADIRRALSQRGLFDNYKTIVFDKVNIIQNMAIPYMFLKIPLTKAEASERKGRDLSLKSVELYGYHKGYRFWHDTMRLLLQDCEQVLRQGKNILFLADSQRIKVSSEGTEDFYIQGPDLYHDASISIFNLVVGWCDYVFRIGYSNIEVTKKHAVGDTTRAIYTQPDLSFYAKSRTPVSAEDPVQFENPVDDTVWRLLWPGK